jgi:opine dehydrogenase
VMASSLSNVNMVLHPPWAILAAAWVEAPHQDFTFYVDALTPGVANVIRVLDKERRAVAAGFGHRLPSLVDEMRRVGTATGLPGDDDVVAAIRGGVANQSIKAPVSLHDRYYEEDLPFAVTPLTVFADLVGVAVPMARALLTVGGGLLGRDLAATGLGAPELGIEGLDLEGVLQIVRGCA